VAAAGDGATNDGATDTGRSFSYETEAEAEVEAAASAFGVWLQGWAERGPWPKQQTTNTTTNNKQQNCGTFFLASTTCFEHLEGWILAHSDIAAVGSV
jgi:hypothetical protein